MRKKNLPHFTPLIRLSFWLTVSIVTAQCCYGYIGTTYWLLSLFIVFGWALLTRNPLRQSIAIYLCMFCLGGSLTSHQLDQQRMPTQVVHQQGLSYLDKVQIAAQSHRFQTEKQLRTLGIDGQDHAIVSAMTLGDKTSLDKTTKDIYSISGASHVLAVSGLHIGIIFQLFILMLGGRRRSLLSVCLSVTAVWAYVLFIGLPASAVRSATMISIYSFALIAHREAFSLNHLALAYVLMLLFNPLYLGDISFQMSFMAVGSIILLCPPMMQVLSPKHVYTKWLAGIFCMSLAAQIGTLPLIVYYFGRISCYSLFTSFIVIPAATVILYLSVSVFVLLCLSSVSWLHVLIVPLLHLAAMGINGVTQLCYQVLQFTTTLPGASLEGIKINIPQLCLIYVSIIVGYIYLKKIVIIQTPRRFRSP